MHIRFAIQCHNFQRRLCWQLSSILQQNPFDADLSIDIACMENNGEPSTEYVMEVFTAKGLNISFDSIYRGGHGKEKFAKRGLVRNDQIESAIEDECDWIFFADCDNVYHPDFFNQLVEQLKTTKATNCIYSKEKIHTEVEDTNAHAKLAMQSSLIRDAYLRAQKIKKTGKRNKNVAAGCMQVCRVSDIVEKNNGLYVDPEKTRDSHLFKCGQGAKSDKQFRRAMGGSTRIYLPTQIHMNHFRDKEEGYHLEEQR